MQILLREICMNLFQITKIRTLFGGPLKLADEQKLGILYKAIKQ